MNRRLFLKAMGLSGALSLTNWKTLAAGPEPGCKIYHGVIKKRESRFIIAGTKLEAGMIVSLRQDGKCYPADSRRMDEIPIGVALNDIKPRQEGEVVTHGSILVDIKLEDSDDS